MREVITYLENGKQYVRYDIAFKRGYSIECRIIKSSLQKFDQRPDETAMKMRSIHINGMPKNYQKYHTTQKPRLYGKFRESGMMRLST